MRTHARRGARGVPDWQRRLGHVAFIVVVDRPVHMRAQARWTAAAAATPARASRERARRPGTSGPSVPRGARATPPRPPRCATPSDVRAEAQRTPRPLPVPCFAYVRGARGGGRGGARWEALEPPCAKRPRDQVCRLRWQQMPAYMGTCAQAGVQPACLMSSLISLARAALDAPADNQCNVDTQCGHQGPQGPRESVPTGSNTRPSSLQRLFASPSPPHTPPLPLEARATNALELSGWNRPPRSLRGCGR
jgi:hypothetical protein